MSVKVIDIEAVIAAGKSTLIGALMEKVKGDNSYILIPEPVDQWKDIKLGDKDILDAFYNDMSTVALPFQLIALLTRRELFLKKMKEAKNLAEETGKTVYLITERTIFSDKFIFADMLHRSGFISEAGILAYKLWNDVFAKELSVDKVIYINTPPDVCMQRIKTRNRDGEDKITLDYLIECQKAHDNFYEQFIKQKNHKIIDTSNIHINTDSYDNLILEILDYINS